MFIMYFAHCICMNSDKQYTTNWFNGISLFCEANNGSANKKISHLLQNLKVHYWAHRSMPLTHILNEINPVNTIYTTWIIRSTAKGASWWHLRTPKLPLISSSPPSPTDTCGKMLRKHPRTPSTVEIDCPSRIGITQSVTERQPFQWSLLLLLLPNVLQIWYHM